MQVYHASNALFTKPKFNQAEANGHDGGFGFYVATVRSLAQTYGQNLYVSNFKPKRALSCTKLTLTDQQIINLLQYLKQNHRDYLENYGEMTSSQVWHETARNIVLPNLRMNENDVDLINDLANAIGDHNLILTWLQQQQYSHARMDKLKHALVIYDLNCLTSWQLVQSKSDKKLLTDVPN